MKRSTHVAVVGAVAALALGAGAIVQVASAHETAGGTSLVEKIATKFNLNKDEVQKVVDEHREEKVAAMEEHFSERLDQAVTDGKITAAQKDLILAKRTEIRQKMEEIKNITDDTARRDAMKQLHTDLEKWADDNNIELRYLHPFKAKGHGGPGHMKGAHVRGGMMFETER